LYDKGLLLTKINKYKKAYKTLRQGNAFIDKDKDLNLFIKYQLLIIDCESSIDEIKSAKKRIKNISSVTKLGLKNQ